MTTNPLPEGAMKDTVDQIPVIWFQPEGDASPRPLAIYLPPLGGTKEAMAPYLRDLAAAGYVALSFDPWQHGERGTEEPMGIITRVFGDFRRYMWPILGQTTLDVLRITDWAVATRSVMPPLVIGGISMGGDIAVAAAGLDHRLTRVAATIATPDWLRPGMAHPLDSNSPLPPGEADSYARYFYDQINPLTHLAAYAHAPAILFMCGERDTHVPPDGALRFRDALRADYPSAAEQIAITLLPERGHLDFGDPALWWPACRAWLTQRQ